MFDETFKNFKIHFNVSNQRGTFSSGDQIVGTISVDVSKDTKVSAITMVLKGKVRVHWSSGSGKSKRNYSAKLEYFDLKSAILQENSNTGVHTRLQRGTHVYPFTCQLPQGDFPSSFQGVHGKIYYNLKVGFHRPWRMAKEFVTELNFLSKSSNQQLLQSGLSGTNQMSICSLWCALRLITLTAKTDKSIFAPGETVKIMCQFNNGSSKTATLKLKLQQKQDFYTHNHVNRKCYVKVLASVSGEPVCAHATDVHTDLELTIPASAPFTISNCQLLVVSYTIEVTLSSWAFPDLTVLIPITLCDIPVQSQPVPLL